MILPIDEVIPDILTSLAARMAFLLGERVGATVGYRIRLDSRVGPGTRIEVVTEGILTRRLQADPALEGVGAGLFDEFHERSLARLLDHAPVIRSEGRAFAVATQYRPASPGARIEGHVAQTVREVLATEPGSVLVFLPGAGEIRRVEAPAVRGIKRRR